MSSRKTFWISFIKKMLLALINIYLLFPIVNLFGPLNELENLAAIEWFVVGTALVTLLLPFWYVWLPIQLGLILFSYQQYFPHQETGLDWLRYQGDQLYRGFEQFFSGDLAVFPTNAALFLILILVSISTYLLINKQKPTYIALTCIVYLLILHVFTRYDFFPYVTQVLLMSVLLFGISQIPVDKGWRQGLLSFSVVTLVGLVFAQTAQWGTEHLVEQQQWIEGKSRDFQRTLEDRGVFDFVDFYSSGGGLNRMGYSEDDSQLGGPVQQNFDNVFFAYDEDPHYWRIATKDLYTGRGWEDMFADFKTPIDYSFMTTNPGDEVKNIWIDRAENFDYIPHTYQLTGIQADETTFETLLPSTEIIAIDDSPFDDYTLTVLERDIDFEGLNEAGNEEYMSVLKPYLHLPSTIPNRVWQLAKDVTEGYETNYEKVRAIEQYLRSDAGLRYSLREASHLPEGADYVDHFLFDALVGYCDNFSTAMVVMARMMGIPARWAKGFNSGVRHTDTDGEVFYEISNANAHSWPEIYFPEHGWLPFEPTPAFNQPLTDAVVTPSENTGFTGGADEGDELEWDETDNLPTAPEDMEDIVEDEEISVDVEDIADDVTDTERWPQVVGGLMILTTILAYLYRRKLFPHLVRQLMYLPFLSVSFKTSLILNLFKLDRRKESHETFRQYFAGISERIPYHQQPIREFVELNEALMYAPKNEISFSKEETQKSLLKMVSVYQDLHLAKKKSNY